MFKLSYRLTLIFDQTYCKKIVIYLSIWTSNFFQTICFCTNVLTKINLFNTHAKTNIYFITINTSFFFIFYFDSVYHMGILLVHSCYLD